MSRLMTIKKDFDLSQEEFYNERRKHLQKKGLSAKKIYRSERARAMLYKIPLVDWIEYLLLYTGLLIWPAILALSNLQATYISGSLICFAILLIKIRIRREKKWKQRLNYLTSIENRRLNSEWLEYKNSSKSFHPNIVGPSLNEFSSITAKNVVDKLIAERNNKAAK